MMKLVALAVLAGCSSIPSEARLDAAQLGPAPRRTFAIEAATQSLRDQLPYDDLSRIGFGSIAHGFYGTGRGQSQQRFAWMMTVVVDAMNEHGFRDGARRYNFYFLGDNLVATAAPTSFWTGGEYRDHYEVTETGGGKTRAQAGLERTARLHRH